MNVMSSKVKNSFLDRVRIIFRNLMKHESLKNFEETKACLFWAYACSIAGGQMIGTPFEKIQLQGGSASWRIVPPHLDDGVNPTHYSYVWDEDLYLKRKVLIDSGMLMIPEVHFWAAIAPHHEPAGKGLIVDLTTKYVPILAAERDIVCKCSPPNEVWMHPDEPPENVTEYVPSLSATLMGVSLLKEHFRRVNT